MPEPLRRPSTAAPARGGRRLGRGLRMLGQYLDVHQARLRGTAPRQLPLLSLETTQACNARCGMCGYPDHYPGEGAPLSSDEWLALIDEAAALGTLVVSLGGGEPFMRRDTESLIRRIGRHGMTALVHSNGALLSPKRCDRLAPLPGLVLSLSLDSPRREVHDALRGTPCFDRLTAAARRFAAPDTPARVTLMCTISRHNYRELTGLLRLASGLGVRSVRFTPVHTNLQHRFRDAAELEAFRVPENELPALAEELEGVIALARELRILTNSRRFLRAIPEAFRRRVDHRCHAGFLFYSLDPYGNLFPCYDHQGGVNVRDLGGLAAACRSEAMARLRQRVLGCRRRCWNVGHAEPSLKMSPLAAAGQLPQLLRETLFYL